MADIDLPAFLDPVLDALSNHLPAPLYNILIHFLAHGIALFAALLSFLGTLIRTNPLDWNAQTLLPPLITLLSAYLALITLYRTTGWVVRTTISFIKWGAIFAALGIAAGWYIGSGMGGGNSLGNAGLMSSFGSFVLDILNGKDQNTAGGSRSRTRSSSSRSSRPQRAERPKPWESFDRHRQWQYQEARQNNGDNAYGDAQQVIGNIVGAAARVVQDSGWWEAARSAMGGIVGSADEDNTESSRRNSRHARSRGSST